MSAIDYTSLTDEEKLDLLRLLYHDHKEKPKVKKLIVEETQKVYNRIKKRSN